MRFSPMRIACLVVVLAGVCCTGQAQPLTNVTTYATSPGLPRADRVPVHGVFELTLTQPIDYGGQRNFDDVAVFATFVAPDRTLQVEVGGFYYATVPGPLSLWKVRFAPSVAGTWTYQYRFTHLPTGSEARGSGSFQAYIGDDLPGFLRQNDTNPFRWIREDGRPFVPIGFNDCTGDNDVYNIDGGDRVGAFVGAAQADVYLSSYAAAGFNMFRYSQANCSPNLANPALTVYDSATAQHFDWLMQRLRAHGFHVFYGLFGYLLDNNPQTPPPPELYRFVDYCVNRWGAYIDVWQLQNERNASSEWIAVVAQHIRGQDPYGHPVTTSWQRPELNEIEINAPHWYQAESEFDSDRRTANLASQWKASGKPVIVGEQGNSTPPGFAKGNWLPDSALRMRLRSWTAFCREISFLFWNTSWATNGAGGGAANLYIGREERQYVQMLQWFGDRVIRADTVIPQPSNVRGFDSSLIRAYGLASADGAAAYFHHYADHVNPVRGQTVQIDIPRPGTGFWIDPATGRTVGRAEVTAGTNELIMPDFTIDLAFFSAAEMDLAVPPIALVVIENPQADGDLDDDGLLDYGPDEPPFGIAPLPLTFDASGSYDLDGGVLTYSWDFGDGSVQSGDGPRITHTYAGGNFLTILTVTDDEGETARVQFLVRATGDPHPESNDPPLQNAIGDVTVREGQLVLITPWAVDRELEQSGYISDDLTYSAFALPSGASLGTWGAAWSTQFYWIPDFSQSGTYNIRFDVRDDEGATAAPRHVTITVLDSPVVRPPAAGATGSGLSPRMILKVKGKRR